MSLFNKKEAETLEAEATQEKEINLEPEYDSDLEFIDLEPEEEEEEEEEDKGIFRFLNFHLFFIVFMILAIFIIVSKLKNWGTYIDLKELAAQGEGHYEDNMDFINPLTDDNGNLIRQDIKNILLFGNSAFSDDRDDENGLASMIEQATGATVYNASIAGSSLSAQEYSFDADLAPMDAFSFYWLAVEAATHQTYQMGVDAISALGPNAPKEAQEVYDMLHNLDATTIDTIVVMYDATDYFDGKQLYVAENPTDINCFSGNLRAGLELLEASCPTTRIIVLSPTFAYAIDENGKYVSCQLYNTGFNTMSSYCYYMMEVCNELGYTYVDNFFGTVNQDNADDYLTDNLHLNQKGRQAVLDRFLPALNYFASASEVEQQESGDADSSGIITPLDGTEGLLEKQSR